MQSVYLRCLRLPCGRCHGKRLLGGRNKRQLSGTTDTTGKITDYSDFVGDASGIVFTCVVDNASAAGSIYDQTANKQTQNSISVP